MNLHFDTRFIESVLSHWRDGDLDWSDSIRMPIFQTMRKQAENYRRAEVEPYQYLNELLHIGGIDMSLRAREIRRNLKLITSVDLGEIEKEVNSFLPRSMVDDHASVTIYPFIGISGYAKHDYIVIDPSPCPWFPADGSDPAAYLDHFIVPTLRHELHHIGYNRVFQDVDTKDMHTLNHLADDFVLQMQMEGGAKLCEKQCQRRDLTNSDLAKLADGITHAEKRYISWKDKGNREIDDQAWSCYYELWEKKTAYWMGELGCLALMASGFSSSVAECMSLNPGSWFEKTVEAAKKLQSLLPAAQQTTS